MKRVFWGCGLAGALLCATAMFGAPVPVRYSQGTEHGYLVLRSEAGEVIGRGDLIQVVHGARVTIELTLHFKDGSLDDETATYTQSGSLHLIQDHHVQKGPFFSKQLDMTVNANGDVAMRSLDKDGKEKTDTQHLDVPADLANGIVSAVIVNYESGGSGSVGMVEPVLGKARLVKLEISPAEPQKFTAAGTSESAHVFRVHMNLGGIIGAVAPIVGKQPADLFLWVAEGAAPQILRLLGPLAEGTPVVSIELAGMSFERTAR